MECVLSAARYSGTRALRCRGDRTFLRLQDDLPHGLLQTVGPQHQLLLALEEAGSSSASSSSSSSPSSPAALLRLLLLQLPLELRQALLALLLHAAAAAAAAADVVVVVFVVVVVVLVLVLPLLLHDGWGGVGQRGQPGLALPVQGLQQGVQLLVQDGALEGGRGGRGQRSLLLTHPPVFELTAFGTDNKTQVSVVSVVGWLGHWAG